MNLLYLKMSSLCSAPKKLTSSREQHMRHMSPRAPLSPIIVGGDLLMGAMRLLTRADLDAMPLVTRHFRRVALQQPYHTIDSEKEQGKSNRRKNSISSSSMLPQCRLIDQLDLGEPDRPFCQLYASSELVAKHPRVFFTNDFCCAAAPGYYGLSDKRLAWLLSHSMNLRAKFTWVYLADKLKEGRCDASKCRSCKVAASLFTVRHGKSSHRAGMMTSFMTMQSLWDGCPLGIYLIPREKGQGDGGQLKGGEGDDFCYLFGTAALSLLGNCSTLAVQTSGSERYVHCGVPMMLNSPAMLRCTSIQLCDYWSGDNNILYEHIAYYLIPGDSAAMGGGARKLVLGLRVSEREKASYAPSRLKQLLEQRLDSVFSPAVPTFSLRLWLEYPEKRDKEMEGNFGLVTTTAAHHNAISQSSAPGNDGTTCQGSFTVKYCYEKVYCIEAKCGVKW